MNEYQRYGDYTQSRREIPRATGIGSAIASLTVGIGIGAALAVLLTPRRGSDLRRAIGRGLRRTVDKVSARTRDLREHGSNLIDFTRRAGERQYGQS